MIAGDWHKQTRWAESVISLASAKGVSNIFQVGDFGLWPGRGGLDFLDDVNNSARGHNVVIRTLRGNHDSAEWERLLTNQDANRHDPITGGVYVRSRIVLMPRTARFDFGGKFFQVVGGAVSVDKDYRIPGESWWPEEEITDAEVDAIPAGKVDVLLTHDCSNRTPWRNRMKPDLDSVAHRQRIDKVLDKTTPDLHFHGHMHEWYDWENRVGGDEWTQTYGLHRDSGQNAQGILDTDTMEFKPLNH